MNPPRLDCIRYDAVDDASGTTSMLEIAEAMSRGAARPRRSVIYVSHTAAVPLPGRPLQLRANRDSGGGVLAWRSRVAFSRGVLAWRSRVAFSRAEHQDCHQVTDETQYISYRDLPRMSKTVFGAARMVGNAAARPMRDVAKPADPGAV